MPVIASSGEAAFVIGATQFFPMVSPSRGSAETAVWFVTMGPGEPGTMHQVTREEIFVALDGAAVVTLDGVDHPLPKDAALVVPPHTDFALSNPHDQPFRALVVLPVGGQATMPDVPPFTPPWAL
ncbi:MAG: cupin domain-containing protein [bacterium]